MKRFLKTNRKNIELGKNLEYRNSKFYFERIAVNFIWFILVLALLYIVYTVILLKNKIILIALLPGLLGITLGFSYRKWIKPSKKTMKYKKGMFIAVIVGAGVLSVVVGMFSIMIMVNTTKDPSHPSQMKLQTWRGIPQGSRVACFAIVQNDAQDSDRLLQD